jgi:hypothetical protein
MKVLSNISICYVDPLLLASPASSRLNTLAAKMNTIAYLTGNSC